MMRDFFLSVFEVSVSTGIMVIALLVAAPFLNKRYASKWKYYTWIALALRLVLPFLIDSSLRPVTIPIPEPMTTPMATNGGMAIPIVLQGEPEVAGMTLLDVIAVVWAVAAIGVLLVHLFSL